MEKQPDLPSRPRRGAGYAILTVLALAVAGAASWEAATRIAGRIETRTAAQIRRALADQDQGWANVQTDGLQVRLTGTAPDEVARFRALTAASGLVDERRISDQMTVAERGLLEPPDFELELMRQGSSISMLGLVPARTEMGQLSERLGLNGAEITDLTSTAAFPPPENWRTALDFAVQAAGMIEQGTVSVTPGAVSVNANATSPEDKTRLEAALSAAAPEGVGLSVSIIAPLPVIAPFMLRFTRDSDGATLEICAAGDEETRDTIVAAAATAGAIGAQECAIGIGAPEGWEQAAREALASIARTGGGTAELIDQTVRVTLPASVSEIDQQSETTRLSQAMPQGFTLNVSRAEADPDGGPPHFTASIGGDGPAAIEGVVPDDTMRQTVLSLARAQLGPMQGELALNPALPQGWALRVMAGLDATGTIDVGRLEVTGEQISISGISGDRLAPEKAVLALSTRLGAGERYSVAIAYDRLRDPTIDMPDGVECVDRLNTVMLESEIGFEPGGARIAGDIAPVIEQIRPIMEDCSDYQIELAGHTDAQGRDESNMQLSLDRAEAVLEALRQAGMDVENITAQGYGETRPIAENDTEEGREANRRIELTLISPRPVAPPLDVAPAVTGLTPTVDEATNALLAASPPDPIATLDATIGDGEIVPADQFFSELLSSPPKVEPPAEVLEATPETPRPPDRPEGEVDADADADDEETEEDAP